VYIQKIVVTLLTKSASKPSEPESKGRFFFYSFALEILMKKFLSTLFAALLLSSLFVSPALACDGDKAEKQSQEEKQ